MATTIIESSHCEISDVPEGCQGYGTDALDSPCFYLHEQLGVEQFMVLGHLGNLD